LEENAFNDFVDDMIRWCHIDRNCFLSSKKRSEVKGEMRRIKKIVCLEFVLVGLVLAELIPMSSIVSVSATQWTGLDFPTGVAIGDYNNDGLNELAIAEAGGGKVTVYKSDGTTIMKQWTGLDSPYFVAVGDYDNDGLNDLAIEETGLGRVIVYKSDGTTVIKQWTGLNHPLGVAIGDYDNDGLNELAFAEADLGRVTVYESDGTTVIKQWTGLSFPVGVAIGDYDNDGLNDLAFTQYTAGSVTVYSSDGTTILRQFMNRPLPTGVAIGDYNNDGLNELTFAEVRLGVLASRVTVYRSDGTTIVRQLMGLDSPYGVAIGDYNNDGLNDLAFTDAWGNSVTVCYQTTPGTMVHGTEPTIVTLRGTLTNATGYPILSGSILVTVEDSLGLQVWQDTFDNIIDNGAYSIPLGARKPLMLIKGRIYNAVLEVDADSPTFVSADVIFGDNNPAGDLIKFVAS
jgi:peptidoglycan hydrolase-like protein with peptidoglycan-binding domain